MRIIGGRSRFATVGPLRRVPLWETFRSARSWLPRFLGWAKRRGLETSFGTAGHERLRDVRDLRLREVEPADLSVDFQAKLKGVCAVDSNIVGVWVTWMSSGDAPPELLAVLLLDRYDEESVDRFVQRANALDGPSCVASVPSGRPAAKAFYQR